MDLVTSWLEKIPQWIKIAFIFGGVLLTSFSSKLPDQLQMLGLWLGATLICVGIVASVLHFFKVQRGAEKVGPSDLIALSLAGLVIFSFLAFAGYLWHRAEGASVGAPAGTGASGVAAPTVAPAETWNDGARLTLTFDNDLSAATASRQDGVRFYYWYSVPAVNVNWETRQIAATPGYVMVFMSLKDPTHTNYSRATVIGGGILCEIISSHPTGAVVRAMGNMSGRTIDIIFDKDPIPLN